MQETVNGEIGHRLVSVVWKGPKKVLTLHKAICCAECVVPSAVGGEALARAGTWLLWTLCSCDAHVGIKDLPS